MKNTNPDLLLTHLLITGEMRSGTTFLANFLNSQVGCSVYSDLLKSWLNEPAKLRLPTLSTALDPRQKNVLFSNLIAEGLLFGLTCFEKIDRTRITTALELFQEAMHSLASPDGCLVGVKVTRQYGYLPELMDHGVKVIFCIRDPRDMLLSAKNRFSEYNLFESVAAWKKSLQLAKGLDDRPNFYLLRFESLMEETTRMAEIARLAQFLDVPLDPHITKLKMRNNVEFVSNSSFGDVSRVFDSQALFRWRRDPQSSEVIFASAFLEKEIAELDYQSFPTLPKEYARLRQAYYAYIIKRQIKNVILKFYKKIFSGGV